ncbi:hypothetical protein PFISCL1PPCAC_21413, partial [Pristionchus fissidentatus]
PRTFSTRWKAARAYHSWIDNILMLLKDLSIAAGVTCSHVVLFKDSNGRNTSRSLHAAFTAKDGV